VDEVFLLAWTAALNPTLLAAVTFMLSRPSAGRLMLGYLIGAIATSMTCGLLIVFALDGSSSFTGTAKHTINPGLDIALGVLILLGAFILGTGRAARLSARRERTRAKKVGKPPPRWQQALNSGSARVGCLVGLMLTLPGASYLVALNRISKQELSTPAIVVAVLGFNIIMLLLLEVPLLGFAIAPEKTNARVQRFSEWLRRRGGRIALIAAVLIGVALVTHGVATRLS
jgi:Sap, sulfolipid-1-addressing protein